MKKFFALDRKCANPGCRVRVMGLYCASCREIEEIILEHRGNPRGARPGWLSISAD